MALLDLPADRWFGALGLHEEDVPHLLVLEGTWWHRKAVDDRLSHLTEVRELAFPDIYLGRFGDVRVAYCCAYGAARAAEPAHVFAQIGTPLVVQIGTCGALTAALRTGQVAVPRTAAAREGVARDYDGEGDIALDADWSARALDVLAARGIDGVPTRHLTGTTLFAQSDALCDRWAGEGYQTVDMETATVAAVCNRFGRAAVAMLAVWDPLAERRTFLDPLDAEAARALARANAATFAAALDLGVDIAARRGTTRAKEEPALS